MPRAANPHTVVVRPWVGRRDRTEPVTLPMLGVYRARCTCRWTSGKYLSAEDAQAAGTAHRLQTVTKNTSRP